MMFHLFRQHSIWVDLLLNLHLIGLDFLGQELQTGRTGTNFQPHVTLTNASASLFVNILGQLFQTLSSIFWFLNHLTSFRQHVGENHGINSNINLLGPHIMIFNGVLNRRVRTICWIPRGQLWRLRSRTRCTRRGNNCNTLAKFRWFWQALGNLRNAAPSWALTTGPFSPDGDLEEYWITIGFLNVVTLHHQP